MRSFLLLLCLTSSLVHAQEATVVAGEDGWLGTFRRLASGARPLPDEQELTLDPSCAECSVVVSDSPRIELDGWVARGHRVVYLGINLEAAHATHLHALFGVTGELVAYLDGRIVGTFSRGRDREDDRLVRLDLSAGRHRLVLRLKATEPRDGVPTRRWRMRMRMLDADFAPGFGSVHASVGELSPHDRLAHARSAIRIDEQNVLNDGTPTMRLVVHAPAGSVEQSVPVRVGDDVRTIEPASIGQTFEFPIPARGPLSPRIEVGGEDRRVGRLIALDRPLLRAMADLQPELAGLSDASRGPLQWRYEEMQRVIREHDSDRAWRQWLVRDVRAHLRTLARGRDPFAAPRGYARMAHISAIDGSAQPYELFVPPAYSRRRAWPVLITLHGFKGNAGDYFRNTFGLARDWRGGETLEAHGRRGTPPTSGPMIVIGPQARGQSMYREMGEVDILEALADVRARFRVDPRRIYVTGGSMGGTGAAFLPFRHPDLFAAAAPLAGYHDQRVRQDTHHEGLSDIERFLQAWRGDIDWTENALHLPMLLVRGTRDRPLAWTRTQVRRLHELRYAHEHREPSLGHNVWTETYAEGAIFDWMARHRLPRAPRHVRLRTARERTQRSHWVRIDGRTGPDVFAEVDARVRGGRIEITTEHVAGITLSPEPPLVASGPLEITIDGQTLSGDAPLSLIREGEQWQVGALNMTGRKRAGVSGPIRDVFHERLVFVVGTRDPRHTFINRQVARDWAHPHGIDVRYPIVDDVDVSPEMIANATLVLIGPPWSNTLHARWHAQLPIRYDWAQRSIVVGGAHHRGGQVGAAFVSPNPDVPEHAIVVLAGTSPLGTWRARFLPDILPDWVVFDASVENARGQWSCGGARRDDASPNGAEPVACQYRAAGFFDMHWRTR